MPIRKGAPKFSVTVQTRHGGVREFVNVKQACSTGMPYNPAKYNLMVVKEPGVGYRCIALEGVLKGKIKRRT